MEPTVLHSKLKGIFHLVMTPFTPDDELDEVNLRLALRDAMKKSKGKDFCFLAGGSTAEFYAMSDEEMKRYIKIVVDEVNGAFPVIMGTSRPGTKATIELTQFAEKAGVDGVMIVPPYYVPCTGENLYKHFSEIAGSIKIGIVIYNNPATSKHWLPPALVGRLSKIHNIIGVKENISNPMSFYRVQKAVDPKDLVVFTGLGYEEYQYLALSPNGCPGYASELVNMVPKITFGIYEAGKTRNWKKMGELVEALEPYRIFCDELAAKRKMPLSVGPFVAGPLMTIYQAVIKECITLLGIPCGKVRAPVDNMTAEEIEDLKPVLAKMMAIENSLA